MNIKEITLPDGWVIDKQIGNKLILKESKPELLDTWEKCFEKLNSKHTLGYINPNSIFIHFFGRTETSSFNAKAFPEEYAKPMLALMQLLVCYKAWIGDWKPDWEDVNSRKYCIYSKCDEILTTTTITIQHTLAFPTSDIRDKFLEIFKDLIGQAKPLL
jgi:hypothetical protein